MLNQFRIKQMRQYIKFRRKSDVVALNSSVNVGHKGKSKQTRNRLQSHTTQLNCIFILGNCVYECIRTTYVLSIRLLHVLFSVKTQRMSSFEKQKIMRYTFLSLLHFIRTRYH